MPSWFSDLFSTNTSHDGYLLVGQIYIGSAYITPDWLNKNNIRDILELGNPILQHLAKELNCDYHYEDIQDSDREADKFFKRFDTIVTYISQAQAVGRAIIIVCPTGRSLSSSIACAYMMCHHGANTDDAIKFVQEQRPTSEVREGFKKVLRIYENVLRIRLLTRQENYKQGEIMKKEQEENVE